MEFDPMQAKQLKTSSEITDLLSRFDSARSKRNEAPDVLKCLCRSIVVDFQRQQ